VSFVAITPCVASQRVFVVYLVIDSVRKILDTPSYINLVIFFSIIRVIKCSTHLRDEKCVHNFVRPKRRWEDNTAMDLKELWWGYGVNSSGS